MGRFPHVGKLDNFLGDLPEKEVGVIGIRLANAMLMFRFLATREGVHVAGNQFVHLYQVQLAYQSANIFLSPKFLDFQRSTRALMIKATVSVMQFVQLTQQICSFEKTLLRL